ncbi:MAG: fatty acid kinase, partial [Mycobacterium sp.]|nr:fatty acid kinase [Mycobacterium sp.]
MGTSDRLLDGLALRDWAHTVVSDLITHIDEINRLNVFPVADSDTGANMLFTMRSALAEADSVVGAGNDDVARVANALSAGALNGARGNSGVILSQILRGIADVTAKPAAESGGVLTAIDAATFGAALSRGVDLVVASMGGEEVPGTIVSVMRAAAIAVEQCAAAGETLTRGVTEAGDAAVVALEKTTEQLDVLADAGVVDAGGRGLLVLLDSLCSTITGQAPVRSVYEPAPRSLPDDVATRRPAPQFEVMYLLAGCGPDLVDALRTRLDELGESVAIAAAASDGGHSVHVHT